MENDGLESAGVFNCGAEQLVGILHAAPVAGEVGVVIVVGGPQYRVGSHRQFVLLARDLADAGFSTLRFDYRGMGDSDGVLRGFEDVTADIRAAIDYLVGCQPTIRRVILWGLCDGATAAAFYAPLDRRVAGLALLNPWVRSEQTLARSLLFHYYFERVMNFSAWLKLLGNPRAFANAVISLARVGKKAFARAGNQNKSLENHATDVKPANPPGPAANGLPLVVRMAASLEKFHGPVLLVLSSADITANEFIESERSNSKLRKRLCADHALRKQLEGADHTFSRKEWRDRVSLWTKEWLADLAATKN